MNHRVHVRAGRSATLLCLLVGTLGAAEPGKTWDFDASAAGQPPAAFHFFRTGDGREGTWEVRPAEGPGVKGNVLAQVSTDATDFRFPVAVADQPVLADARVSVRCEPVSGEVDQACGLVFRFQDAGNYYLTRANALEGNVNLYYVKDGHRRQIAGWRGEVAGRVWHHLEVMAQGDRFQVSWDGKPVIDHRDRTFSAAGRVGVWTKADSVTLFDDLAVEPR